MTREGTPTREWLGNQGWLAMRKKVLFVGVALLGFAIPHQAWATDLTATDDASSPVWGTDTVEITANDGLGTNSFGVRGDGCKIGNLTATTANIQSGERIQIGTH